MPARILYNVLLALCILWCLPAKCLIIVGTVVGVSALLKGDTAPDREAMRLGLAFAFEGALFGLPGFLGARLLKRKLLDLDHPTQVPPGFEVLTPDSDARHKPPRHR